jgi:hypothetical protein
MQLYIFIFAIWKIVGVTGQVVVPLLLILFIKPLTPPIIFHGRDGMSIRRRVERERLGGRAKKTNVAASDGIS